MKAERYYDVGCDFCAKHLSTDFGTGMFPTKEEAIRAAKTKGFRTRDGKNICPDCLEANQHEEDAEALARALSGADPYGFTVR